MTIPCLVVLTARGPSRLLTEGGTQAWRLKPGKVELLTYCICVQNRHGGHWGNADQEHHHAFMVGRISGVVPSSEGRERYLVKFSEYARIDFPNAWPGHRNPVRYSSLEEFGITDPNALTWHPMPTSQAVVVPAGVTQDEDRDGPGPLTMAEAKAGLALGLGVPESVIEITIRF
ncbi:hypothetical protein HUW63_04775 [Myxococcus sp. AM001]|nr:hypothetical protein [Myxococcus sp. AM001]